MVVSILVDKNDHQDFLLTASAPACLACDPKALLHFWSSSFVQSTARHMLDQCCWSRAIKAFYPGKDNFLSKHDRTNVMFHNYLSPLPASRFANHFRWCFEQWPGTCRALFLIFYYASERGSTWRVTPPLRGAGPICQTPVDHVTHSLFSHDSAQNIEK